MGTAGTRKMQRNPVCQSSDAFIEDAKQASGELGAPDGQDLTAILVGLVPNRLNSVICAGGAYIDC